MDESTFFHKSLTDDSDSFMNASVWDWDTTSFQKELDNLVDINEKNLDGFSELQNEIRQLNEFDVKNPIEGDCDKITAKFTKCEDEVHKSVVEYKSELKSMIEENATVKRNITNLQNELKSIRKEIEGYEKKTVVSKKQEQKALKVAANMHQISFDIKVETENICDDTYLAKLYFSNDKTGLSPMVFTISRSQRKIIEWDSSAILTEEQERELRKQFTNLDNIPALVCEVRKMVFNN